MPKTKTHKGAAKRFKKTGSGKIVHRRTGQDHFNARESGNTGTAKKRDVVMTKSHARIDLLIVHKK